MLITCPNCLICFEHGKPAKKVTEQVTKTINGQIYYGKLVNYTTGPARPWRLPRFLITASRARFPNS